MFTAILRSGQRVPHEPGGFRYLRRAYRASSDTAARSLGGAFPSGAHVFPTSGAASIFLRGRARWPSKLNDSFSSSVISALGPLFAEGAGGVGGPRGEIGGRSPRRLGLASWLGGLSRLGCLASGLGGLASGLGGLASGLGGLIGLGG